MKANELQAPLDEANTKLGKIITEIKVLKDAVANGPDLPQSIVDSVAKLTALTGEADDLNPDAPVPTPPTP